MTLAEYAETKDGTLCIGIGLGWIVAKLSEGKLGEYCVLRNLRPDSFPPPDA